MEITSPHLAGRGDPLHMNDSGRIVKEPFLKRPLDILLSALMIILSMPVCVPIALAIKLEDGGPVFYRQKRWGRAGSPFSVYKFRTMRSNADDVCGIRQAAENDIRITFVGRWLRAMGLDELPQVINIFLGQMSFVGPRSLAVGEIVTDHRGRILQYETIQGFRQRLQVRPGLTGLAAIFIPKDAHPRHKFRIDRMYIRNMSFWLDMRLIFLSYWISFTGNWETRKRKV